MKARGWTCLGIEVAGLDQYQWDSALGQGVTLFPTDRYEALARRRIRTAVTQALDDHSPAAVAINGWAMPEALAAARWCVRNRRRSILMSETHERSGQIWKEWLKHRRANRCHSAIVGGCWHADYLASLRFPRDRIVLGYDAVDNEHFRIGAERARHEKSSLRQTYALPEKYFYASTRFLQRKNVDGLLRAYAEYRAASASPWSLVITGSGEMEKVFKRLALSLDIGEHVIWPGFVQYDHLPIFYGLASAFVHVAHREAWGLVVNEAAAVGLPLIVGSRVGASCELVKDGQNGVLVHSHNVGQISRAMMKTEALSPEERAQISNHSRQLVQRFSLHNFGRAVDSAVRKAIEHTKGRGNNLLHV